MDVKDAISKRTSIRKYQDTPVPDELIDAARLAPSGNNAQPWRFAILKGKAEELKKNEIFPQDFVYTAPAIIICCTDPGVYKKTYLDDTNELRALRDLSIASAFLVLRATELGLGTCYIGWMDKKKIKKMLNLPDTYIAPYAITVGYPAEKPASHKRKGIKDLML